MNEQAPPPPDVEHLLTHLADLIAAVDQAHPLARGADMSDRLFLLRTAFPYAPPPESSARAWSTALHAALLLTQWGICFSRQSPTKGSTLMPELKAFRGARARAGHTESNRLTGKVELIATPGWLKDAKAVKQELTPWEAIKLAMQLLEAAQTVQNDIDAKAIAAKSQLARGV